jgi:siroheme synthase
MAAAIVADGTLPQQQIWRGTLGELVRTGGALDGDGPGLIVIGHVAGLDLRSTIHAGTAVHADEASTRQSRRSR